jgi:hypothetical protein
MNTLYLVRYENSGEPESFVGGLYDNEQDAENRCQVIEAEGYEYVWYDEVQLGDLDLCNR